MSKASNRIVLFVFPLLFGLREVLLYGTLRWEETIERSFPVAVTSEWEPLRRRRQSAEDGFHEASKADGRETSSFDDLLTSIQRIHAAEIDTTTEDQLEDNNNLTIPDRAPEPRIQVRSYPRRNASFPCFPAEPDWLQYNTVQRQPTHEGLFYVKTHKTASTTVMGITIRLAKKLAERNNEIYHTRFHACKSRFEHWPARLLEYRHRKRDQSFLFAVIREPTKRAISM